MKMLICEVDKYGDLRVDGMHIPKSELTKARELYKDFSLLFRAACWLVTDNMVKTVKDKFMVNPILQDPEVCWCCGDRRDPYTGETISSVVKRSPCKHFAKRAGKCKARYNTACKSGNCKGNGF